MDFYHPSVCHTCKSTKNLKLCGKCKSLSYCSKEHQTRDWPKHKSICKAIFDTDQKYNVKRLYEMEGTNIFVIKELESKLRRSLYANELSIWMFRPLCLVCNSRDAHIVCKVCSSVFYCSVEHQKIHAEKHKAHCASIKISFDFLLFNYHTLFKGTPKLLEKEICLQVLPKNLMKLMKFLEDGSHMSVPKKLGVLEHILNIDALAPAANILFGLEKANLLKNQMLQKNDLVVHIVGASLEESTWNWTFLFEFTFHWIKKLNKLTFVAIGPNLRCRKFSWIQSSICGFCNMKPSNVNFLSYSDYYHNVIDVLEKPDLVVAFNCGISIVPGWIPSIPSLLKYPGVPLVLTDYYLELIITNVKLIEKHAKKETKVMLKPQRNPFSYLRPERCNSKTDPIVYNNAYIAILKTT